MYVWPNAPIGHSVKTRRLGGRGIPYVRPLASARGAHCSGGVQWRRRRGTVIVVQPTDRTGTPLSPVFIPRCIWAGYRDGSVRTGKRPVDRKRAASTSTEGRKPAYRPQPSGGACVAYDPVHQAHYTQRCVRWTADTCCEFVWGRSSRTERTGTS